MLSQLGSAIIIIPLIAILESVAIAKAFGETIIVIIITIAIIAIIIIFNIIVIIINRVAGPSFPLLYIHLKQVY